MMVFLDVIFDGFVDFDNGFFRFFNYLLFIFVNFLCDNFFYFFNIVFLFESMYVMLIEINKWFVYFYFGKLYYVVVVSVFYLL